MTGGAPSPGNFRSSAHQGVSHFNFSPGRKCYVSLLAHVLAALLADAPHTSASDIFSSSAHQGGGAMGDTRPCPICAVPMVRRQNQESGEDFLSCARFPACRGSGCLAPEEGGPPRGPPCARCKAKTVLRRNRKSGVCFWGCPEWPLCPATAPVLEPLHLPPAAHPVGAGNSSATFVDRVVGRIQGAQK